MRNRRARLSWVAITVRGGDVQEFMATACTTELYELGEGCRWDDVRGELQWVDILTGRFFRALVDAQQVDIQRTYELTGMLSAFAPMQDRTNGWIADARTMYFVDSGPGTVCAFDVDANGDVSNQRVLVQFDVTNEGTPDGLCMDAEGALWLAVGGGDEVRRYSPSGEQLARVQISTAQ